MTTRTPSAWSLATVARPIRPNPTTPQVRSDSRRSRAPAGFQRPAADLTVGADQSAGAGQRQADGVVGDLLDAVVRDVGDQHAVARWRRPRRCCPGPRPSGRRSAARGGGDRPGRTRWPSRSGSQPAGVRRPGRRWCLRASGSAGPATSRNPACSSTSRSMLSSGQARSVRSTVVVREGVMAIPRWRTTRAARRDVSGRRRARSGERGTTNAAAPVFAPGPRQLRLNTTKREWVNASQGRIRMIVPEYSAARRSNSWHHTSGRPRVLRRRPEKRWLHPCGSLGEMLGQLAVLTIALPGRTSRTLPNWENVPSHHSPGEATPPTDPAPHHLDNRRAAGYPEIPTK